MIYLACYIDFFESLKRLYIFSSQTFSSKLSTKKAVGIKYGNFVYAC